MERILRKCSRIEPPNLWLRKSFICNKPPGRFVGSLDVNFDAHWGHERTGQHPTTSKYYSWAFDVGCWMFTWALNVECRKLNVDEHSTLNIQRSTPKAPLNPVSWTTLPHPSNPQFTLQLLIDDARRDDVGGDV